MLLFNLFPLFDLSEIGDRVQHALETAPSVPVESLTIRDSQPLKCNYVDCIESNDEEEEEEKGDIVDESNKSKETKNNELELNSSSIPPKWEDFFTTETLPDSQNSLTSRSCSVPSPSLSRVTGSQTPELFSDGEEEESTVNDEDFSLTLSASLSSHSSQNQDSELADTLILRHGNAGSEHGCSSNSAASQKGNNPQTEPEAKSESQASSDFDIPSTPESKKPRTDELLLLYRKLAAGDEMLLRKTSSQ